MFVPKIPALKIIAGMQGHPAFRYGPMLAAGLVFTGYLIYLTVFYLEGFREAKEGKPPLFTDYTSTYAASLLAQKEPAVNLFIRERMYMAEVEAARAAYNGKITEQQAHSHGYARFLYPPTFIFFCFPLAFFSYMTSYLVWLGATGGLYFASIRAILPSRWAWPIALAAPPTFLNAIYGQTGYLSAGLIGLGLALLQRRPVFAGVLIGLAAVKPHLGLLIPVALIAGGYWRAFGAACATVISTIGASILVFGIDPWLAFIGSNLNSGQRFELDAFRYHAMVSPFSTIRLAGGSIDLAWIGQWAATFAVAGLVIWAWARKTACDPGYCLRPALLCFAAALATPMVYLYDLAIIVPGIAWLVRDMLQRGHRPWEVWTLLVTVSSILGLMEFALLTKLQLGAPFTGILMVLAVRRLKMIA